MFGYSRAYLYLETLGVAIYNDDFTSLQAGYLALLKLNSHFIRDRSDKLRTLQLMNDELM
jgi:hypothetical protein